MPSSFEDLKSFLVLVEAGSFVAAAEKLGVSRTTLHRQMQAMEERVGVPLLRRGADGIDPTEAGRRLVGGAQRMESEYSALLHAVREAGERPTGDVNVLLPVGLPTPLVALLYKRFLAAWPEIRLHATHAVDPLAALADTDVVLWFGLATPGPPWETRTAFRMRQRLFATPGYLDQYGRPASVEDLSHHNIIAWTLGGERELRLPTSSGLVCPIVPTATTADVHWIHECVALGTAIGWAPDGGLALEPAGVLFEPVLGDVVGQDTELRIAFPSVLASLSKLRVLVDAVRSFTQALPSDESGG